MSGGLHGAAQVLALWGLSFKPDTDDMHQAPSLTIVSRLVEAGATVVVTDPVSEVTAAVELDPTAIFMSDPYGAVQGADALLLVTEWSQYRDPDWSRVASLMRGDRVYDGRNFYSRDEVAAAGLQYSAVGRGL